jgi:four helix bundle protein
MIKNYKDLIVWQKSMDLVEDVYRLTSRFPAEEKFGLVVQLRRAVVSVPSNIAEGHSRTGDKDYVRFLSIAIGSLAEVETQMLICLRLRYTERENCTKLFLLIEEVQKMLHTLRLKLSTP